ATTSPLRSPSPSTARSRPPPAADYAGSRLAQLAVQVMTRLVAPRWKVDDAGPQFAAAPLAHPGVARHLSRLRRFAAIALRSSHPGATHMTLYALLLVQRLLVGPAVPSLPFAVSSSTAPLAPAPPPPLPATLSSPTRLLLAGLVLAESQLADAQTSCAIWARAAGVPQGARGVAALKRDALAALGWDVAVPAAVYASWTAAVRAAVAPPPMPMPMPMAPPPARRTASPLATAAAAIAADDRAGPSPGSPAAAASPARAADTPPRRPLTGGWSS
ncbi:hypothetical protein HK405_006261, partial [Cladochytrium tenue]